MQEEEEKGESQSQERRKGEEKETTLEELIRILIANGTSPWMDQVYQDLALMIGFLILTMFIEAGAFWLLFRGSRKNPM
jgi:hypothetical protein